MVGPSAKLVQVGEFQLQLSAAILLGWLPRPLCPAWWPVGLSGLLPPVTALLSLGLSVALHASCDRVLLCLLELTSHLHTAHGVLGNACVFQLAQRCTLH